MRLLLDTHTLLWSADGPSKLTPAALAALQDTTNDLLLSAATVWELAIKVGQESSRSRCRTGRGWKRPPRMRLGLLPIAVEYAERLSALPPHHKVPFDRLMIAQALVAGIPVVGADPTFDRYGVVRIW